MEGELFTSNKIHHVLSNWKDSSKPFICVIVHTNFSKFKEQGHHCFVRRIIVMKVTEQQQQQVLFQIVFCLGYNDLFLVINHWIGLVFVPDYIVHNIAGDVVARVVLL